MIGELEILSLCLFLARFNYLTYVSCAVNSIIAAGDLKVFFGDEEDKHKSEKGREKRPPRLRIVLSNLNHQATPLAQTFVVIFSELNFDPVTCAFCSSEAFLSSY